MYDYLLFIDTETSGIPKNWKEPTSNVKKWPYILQIAWCVYKKNGEKLFCRNYYIDVGEIEIDKNAFEIHGIKHEFLAEKGIRRSKVLKLLNDDLITYSPLIIGHFIEFDKKMMEVGFTRAGFKNTFSNLSRFCTMQYSTKIAELLGRRSLRLDELYRHLFNEELENYHNAKYDVEATCKVFFELMNRGDINDRVISKQNKSSFSFLKSVFTNINFSKKDCRE